MLVDETKPDTLSNRAAARQALADAVNAVADARARLDEAKRAADLGMDRGIELRNRLDALTQQLSFMHVNANAADGVVAALARGGELLDVERSPAEKLQSEIADLERSLASVRRAREIAEEEVKRRKSALSLAEMRVKRMAAGVLRASGAAERLLHGLAELQERVVQRRLGLRFLLEAGAIPDGEITAVESFLEFNALPAPASRGDFYDWAKHPTHVAWEAALKELQRDADARLPLD